MSWSADFLCWALLSFYLCNLHLANCVTQPPNCTITFHEEGSHKIFHKIIEVEPRTFVVVKFNATKSESRRPTKDFEYFTSVFGDDGSPPPYAQWNCQSFDPVDFEFEGVGALDFFSVWKTQERKGTSLECKPITDPHCTVYHTNAQALLLPQATGKYIFFSVADKNISTSFFIFAESKSKPFLIGASSTRSHVLKPKRIVEADNTTTVILPCVASNYNVTVNLYMVHALDHQRTVVPQIRSTAIKYDRKQGFIGTLHLMPEWSWKWNDAFVTRLYKCTTGHHEDSDFVHVDLRPEILQDGEPDVKPELTLFFANNTAICRSSTKLTAATATMPVIEMSNMYSRNPTESRLLAECMMKGNSYCGTHSYHLRKQAGTEGPVLGVETNCNQPTCSQIQDVHPGGLVYCSQGSSHTMSEYFTGLDGVIYTDWKSAPQQAVLRPRMISTSARGSMVVNSISASQPTMQKLMQESNQTIYGPFHQRTGNPSQIYCGGVKMLMTDPIAVKVKYSNGSVIQLNELWWKGGHVMFFTPDMVQISCEARLWAGNEEVSTTVQIEVEDADCEWGQFKCESNGECIGEDALCDGDERCTDGSDEKKSTCQKFRPRLLQSPSEVTFVPYWRNDLICKLSTAKYPKHLKPILEWYHNGMNLTDPRRVWRDLEGQSLLLRFLDVSIADEGEYMCVATNKFGTDSYKVQINVLETNGSVSPTKMPPVPPTSTPATATGNPTEKIVTVKPAAQLPIIHVTHHFEEEPKPASELDTAGGNGALTAGATIIVLVIVLTLAGAGFVVWKHYNGIPFRCPRFASSRDTTRGSEFAHAYLHEEMGLTTDTEQIVAPASGNVYREFE